MSIQEEWAAFTAQLPKLLEESHGKWVVVRNGVVDSLHEDAAAAYRAAREKFGLAEVLVTAIAREDETALHLGLSVS